MESDAEAVQRKYQTPGLRELAWWELVRFIEHPDRLVEKAQILLKSEIWEEMVVGLALVSGRCLPEVLKMGVLVPKKRYSLLFTSYQEQADRVLGPFELPTLVEAEAVLSAWSGVRTKLDCSQLSAQQICAQYRSAVCQSAKAHFAQWVAVDEHQDWYAPLYMRLYPLLAARYYCPTWMMPEAFQEIVRGFEWPPSCKGECQSDCQQCWQPCCEYKVGDGSSNSDGRQGLKLDQEGVELLEWIPAPQGHSEHGGLQRQPTVQLESEVNSSFDGCVPMQAKRSGSFARECEEGKRERNLKERALQQSSLTEEEWEAYEAAVVLKAYKQIQQEHEASAAKKADVGRMIIIFLDEPFTGRLDAVRQREGTSTLDGTLTLLLDGYEWLHRGGNIPMFLPEVNASDKTSPGNSYPLPYAIRQETASRLEAIDQVKAAEGLEHVVERVLDTYEWLMQGGLAKTLFEGAAPGPAGVWLNVAPHLKNWLEEIGEAEGTGSDDTLATLLWTYEWGYRSGLFEQIKALASTALSCLELDEDDQKKIEYTMEQAAPEDRFRCIQELCLTHARDCRVSRK